MPQVTCFIGYQLDAMIRFLEHIPFIAYLHNALLVVELNKTGRNGQALFALPECLIVIPHTHFCQVRASGWIWN